MTNEVGPWKNSEGQLHHLEGPALVMQSSGIRLWYENGLLNRVGGPAIEHPDGAREWWQKGKQHRIGGPAVEFPSGHKEWWLYGRLLEVYFPNFGCASTELKTREQALARLNSKPRPYTYALYLADIDARWPETAA